MTEFGNKHPINYLEVKVKSEMSRFGFGVMRGTDSYQIAIGIGS
jgi:hypothetical protein